MNMSEEERRQFVRAMVEILDNHAADLTAAGFDPANKKAELTALAEDADDKEAGQVSRPRGTRHRQPGSNHQRLQGRQQHRGFSRRPARQRPRPLENHQKTPFRIAKNRHFGQKTRIKRVYPRITGIYPRLFANYPRLASNYPRLFANYPRLEAFQPGLATYQPRLFGIYPWLTSFQPRLLGNYP